MKLFSHVRLLVTPWTAAYLAPSSMGFSRQEYWSGVPLPSPMLNIRSSDFSYLTAENLYPITKHNPTFPPSLVFYPCFDEFNCQLLFYSVSMSLTFQIDAKYVIPWSVCISLIYFTYQCSFIHVHSCCHDWQDFHLWKGWIYHIFLYSSSTDG